MDLPFLVSTHGKVAIYLNPQTKCIHNLFELRKLLSIHLTIIYERVIGAQHIGSKYEYMVFIDWYTFWNSDP